MKKLLAVVLAALMLFTLAACGGNGGEETTTAAGDETTAAATGEIIKTITTGTGGNTGTYYAFTTAVGQVLSTDDYKFNVISTGGSQANIEMIADGEAQFAIVQNDVMNYAYEGTNGFAAPIKDFSAVACIYSEVCQLVATEASGIKSMADLKGKTVAVGDVGSGVYYNAQQILEAAGLDIDKDIKKKDLSIMAGIIMDMVYMALRPAFFSSPLARSNFCCSKSSRTKDFTTRIPCRFSCTTLLSLS